MTSSHVRTLVALAILLHTLSVPSHDVSVYGGIDTCPNLQDEADDPYEPVDCARLIRDVQSRELRQSNPEGLAGAIRSLGDRRCDDAIPALISLLTFKWVPPDELAHPNVVLHPVAPRGSYPASGALFCYGVSAVEPLMDALCSAEGDDLLCANIVGTVEDIYVREDIDRGITLLDTAAKEPKYAQEATALRVGAQDLRELKRRIDSIH